MKNKNSPFENQDLPFQLSFQVRWSEEDDQWIGTNKQFPSLSHLDPDPTEALKGIMKLLESVLREEND